VAGRRRLHLRAPVPERAVMPGQELRGRLAHLRDAERVDEPVERDAPALLDRSHQLACADLAPAFAPLDLLGLEAEDVAGPLDQPVLPERGDMLGAQALDVEGGTRDEMLQPLDRLSGADEPAGAAPRDLARLAHGEAAAHRAR